MSKKFIFLIVLCSITLATKGQRLWTVSSKDTSFIIAKPIGIEKFSFWGIDFKEYLKDGLYECYFGNRRSKKNIQISGEFINGKRNGVFKYYYTPKRGIFSKPQLSTLINYKDGIIDGYFASFYPNGVKIIEGFINNGKLDGFFIEREIMYISKKKVKKDFISCIYLYKDGNLVCKESYGINENFNKTFCNDDLDKN